MNQIRFKHALIIGSGEDVPCAPPLVGGPAPLVICADGGAALARRWGVRPAAILGDQDSLDPKTKEYWQGQGVPFRRFSTNKDETDLDLAVEYALQMGATKITLVGAWGSRLDHSLGNLELLYRLAVRGVPNRLVTKDHCLSAFCGEFQAEVSKGSIVSLLPLSPVVEKVTSTGLLYPLQETTISKGSTLTISNEAVQANISLQSMEGVLLVVVG